MYVFIIIQITIKFIYSSDSMWFHYPMNWGFSFSALPGKGNTSGAGPYILAAGTACQGNAMSQGHGWSMEKHHEMQQYFRLVNIYIYPRGPRFSDDRTPVVAPLQMITLYHAPRQGGVGGGVGWGVLSFLECWSRCWCSAADDHVVSCSATGRGGVGWGVLSFVECWSRC